MSSFTEVATNTAEDMRKHLTEKAGSDLGFRNELIADPRATIEKEFGLEIPAGINVEVHASDLNTLHLALPVSPDLDEEQLEAIAAGRCCCW